MFDDARYSPGRVLIFTCPSCAKQFRLRLPDKQRASAPEKSPVATLVVLENAFQLKQEIPLFEGENIVGREVKGTQANAPVRTVDPSIDTTHCILSVRRTKDGRPSIVLRDAPSNTGTFLHGDILGDRDRVELHDGDIINIGAATIILRLGDEETFS